MADFFDTNTARELTGTHDVRLSQWGPYTKSYMGISHIPEITTGLRFDVSLFPSLYRRKSFVPNVTFDCGYHPWKATADLSYYVHRHEMIWKDQLYADVSYLRVSENKVYVHARFVNTTAVPQNVGINWLASLNFPPAKTYSNEPLDVYDVTLPEGGVWIDAMSYDTLAPRPDHASDNLVWDGHLRGEAFGRRNGLVGGRGLQLGPWTDDTVTYSLKKHGLQRQTTMVMRYHTYGNATRLRINDAVVELAASDDYATTTLRLDCMSSDRLTIVCQQGRVVIDGFAMVRADQATDVSFSPAPRNTVPETTVDGATMRLKYDAIANSYGMAWDAGDFGISRHSEDSIDALFARAKGSDLWDDEDSAENGRWTNVYVRPLFVGPNSYISHFGMIVNGTDEEVEASLAMWEEEKKQLPDRFAVAENSASLLTTNPSGERYQFSQERMAATMLTNVVYPISTRGTYIRHYTPGRQWDCLYTWDSGFIGLGLAELDLERSLDNLNAYLTEPGTDGAVFIHHGTPVPVQFYQFLELWNRTQDNDMAAYFYPRLRQYHRFLAGHDAGSTTRTLKSNLLRTWDYFYNSGGWDDYPAQSHTHHERLKTCVTPAVNTAHAIRTAKILKMIATVLGEPTEEYDADIAMFSDALQTHSWDEKSGYYSYVLHDDDGVPTGPVLHKDGQNFNMGLDGTSPLVAGICTLGQEEALVERLMDPKRIWSCCGLSTVDQSAAYYADNGYWNGSVWMPHQWFMWKSLLSLGYGDEAYRIAHTGLETWKREVEETYNCFELFNVKTGRGAHWHHFGGLSSPVLCWFNAYHSAGRLTVGLDTHVASTVVNEPRTLLEAELNQYGAARSKPIVIAVLAPESAWDVTFDGAPCQFVERGPGTLEITLPSGDSNGRLSVSAR